MVESINAWLTSSTALVMAIAGLVGAIASLTKATVDAWKTLKKAPKGPKPRGSAVVRQVVHRRNSWFLLFIGFISIPAVIGSARFILPEPLASNARLTVTAWEALNRKDWATAFALSSECVDTFGAQGEDEQRQLEQGQVSQPRTGKVLPDERQTILARGLLNDVGACLWIQGQSAEKLGRQTEARAAYKAAAQLTYARVYDPNGDFFWSPAGAASARLRTLQ